MVVLDEEGKPDFDALQNVRLQKPSALVFYVFDVLYYKDRSLLDEPLIKRKELLKEILPQHPQVRYTDHLLEQGEDLFQVVESRGMEGIVAKKINSKYQPGVRSNDWYKIATEKIEDFVVGGYQLRDDQDKLKSLIFGAFKAGKLIFVGISGAGMKEEERKTMLPKLEPLQISHCPFSNNMNYPEDDRTRWIKPELVISAKFHTYTASKHIRKPAIFKGFRTDKEAEEVLYDDLFESTKVE
jgi:bifunctional non-homologous end joining protein LigD